MYQFQEPPRNGLEVRWSLFGVRFRLFPSFFVYYGILAAILIYAFMQIRDPIILAIGVAIDLACITVGFLFVGFMQALVYRSYGLRSAIVLREFSSGTYPEALPPYALQRIVVALSYSAACFLMFAIIHYSNAEFKWSETSMLANIIYFFMRMMALFWAIIGLLPIVPYSGGVVMIELFTALFGRRGLALALIVSIAVALAYVVYVGAVHFRYMQPLVLTEDAVLPASIILAVFFALSISTNYQWLQQLRALERMSHVEYDDDNRPPWER